MSKFNHKEMQILSIFIAIWGISFIGTGIVLNSENKTIEKTRYSLNIEQKKIATAEAKTNEIKLKEIEIELNNPISVNVKDYLEDIEKLSDEIINNLKLDTSLVNINEPGNYQYVITYKKKKYIGTIKIKEKELPNFRFTLKSIKLTTGDSLSTNPRTYINETISNEIYNNITLDISQVNNQVQGSYKYYIIYKGTKYEGDIIITDPGPKVITPSNNNNNSDNNENTTIDDTEPAT